MAGKFTPLGGALRSEVYLGGVQAKPAPITRATWPDKVSLRPTFAAQPVVKQSFNDCVTNASCGLAEWVSRQQWAMREPGTALMPPEPLSRMQAYTDAKNLQAVATHAPQFATQDSGVAMAFLAEAFKKNGVAPERIWGYTRSHLLTEPNQTTRFFQHQKLLSGYAWLAPKDASGNAILNVDGTYNEDNFLACLTGKPIFGDDRDLGVPIPFVICIVYYNNLSMDPRTGVVAPPPTLGGMDAHCILITGFDRHKGPDGAWEFRNSWGTGYGDGGYGWLSRKYLTPTWSFDPCAFGRFLTF